MQNNLILFLLVFSFTNAFTQVSNNNAKFELHLDSIERKVILNKWGTDSSYYLHYSVTNISEDTLIYLTNSCFYYNHYSLKVGTQLFDLNQSGGCYCNVTTLHLLPSGVSFKKSELFTSNSLNSLATGEWNVCLSIPLVRDTEKIYRVDGRTFVKNEEYIIFDEQTKIIETYIDNRRLKRNVQKAYLKKR